MTGRLRPIPVARPRALGLVRVSKDRDGQTISPEIQRTAITDYSAGRGYEVVAWLEGIDESGSRARSAWWPRLDQAVAAVEAGEYDVIVVWEFSRAARHRLRWAAAIDRVETAGGRLESATERVDVSTASGRFQRGVLSEMHAYRAEAIGEGWKGAHASRIRAGKPATGKPRYGYRYDAEQKVHVPDPETGPVLADIYRRYVAGESVYELVRWLNRHGWRTTAGGLWSDRSLRRVMDSGFASGRFMANGTLHDGVHQALIDDQLWQAYQDARGLRRARPARAERSQYLLSGLVKCGRCGGTMVAGQFGAQRQPKYRCRAGKEQGPEVCTGGYVMEAYLVRLLLEDLALVAGDVDERRDADAAARAHRGRVAGESKRLRREVAGVESAMVRLQVQHAKRPMPEAVYRRSQAELEVELEQLRGALEVAERAGRLVVARPSTAARGLLETWDLRPVEHRREALRSWFVREIRVWSGRPRARVEIVHVWDDVAEGAAG